MHWTQTAVRNVDILAKAIFYIYTSLNSSIHWYVVTL